MHAYLIPLLISIAISFLLAMHFTPKQEFPKFTLPPRHIFIGDYGNNDVIHRVTYQGLFKFGERMQKADVLILGSSHAELGLSAEKISQQLSTQLGRRIRVMNLGVGWGEAYAFQKQVLKHNHFTNKTLLIEVYETLNWDAITLIGQPVLKESKLTSYMHVFETWSLVYRDWLLDGILPRLTLSDSQFSIQRFLTYPVGFRSWKTGDVWDYWFPNHGLVYRNTPSELVTYPVLIANKTVGNPELFNHILDPVFLKQQHLRVLTTFVPTDKTDYEYYVQPPQKLGIPFIHIPNESIALYDGGHTNSNGREAATTGLIKSWLENKTAMQYLNQGLEYQGL